MPAPRPTAPPASPAVAARIRQLAAQAEHRRAITEFRTRRAARQQACVDALLLEAIAALASLLSQPGRTGNQEDGTACDTRGMSNAPRPWLLTVRELREALNVAHPDQVVTFSLSDDDLAALGSTVPQAVRIVFTVKVDRASPDGPVFRLTSGGQQPTG